MKLSGLIGTLAGLGMSLQGVIHAPVAFAHQAENVGGHGVESLMKQPNCDVFFRNEAGQWEEGISEHVANRKACVEVGRSVHQQNVGHMKEDPLFVPPLLRVEYYGENTFINPPETPLIKHDEEYHYPVQ